MRPIVDMLTAVGGRREAASARAAHEDTWPCQGAGTGARGLCHLLPVSGLASLRELYVRYVSGSVRDQVGHLRDNAAFERQLSQLQVQCIILLAE